MTTDKKLLKLAAKAAGMIINYQDAWNWVDNVGVKKDWGLWKSISIPTISNPNPRPTLYRWNPLTDDGDALRLAVKLGLNLEIRKHYPAQTQIMTRNKEESLHGFYVGVSETHDNDPYAATRRAIVRAAAMIGESM